MSYNTISEADTYFSGKFGYDTWATYAAPKKSQLLASASQYLDSLCPWYGSKLTPSQVPAFPRVGANPVPNDIKTVELEIAYSMGIKGTGRISESSEAPLTELKAGSVTFKFGKKTVNLTKEELLDDLTRSLLSNYGNCVFGSTKIIPMVLA